MKTALAYTAIALAILALFAGMLRVLQPAPTPAFDERNKALEEASKMLKP